ncbi:CapA family protein [Cohnella yongneupensis]|uniref:CapA family protein n=1 Tax=Cohnella yongneupensis TaxID=425006 RepID=A0ABW0R3L3_9BACL
MKYTRKFAWTGMMLSALLMSACSEATPSPAPPASERASPSDVSPSASATPNAKPVPSESPTEQAKEPTIREATLLAVGDIMAHSPQLPAYYDHESNRYTFDPWFDQVKPILQAGDWVFGNIETPLAGAELKYSGYPRFNAPAELADAIAGAGFQIVSTANNHTMDRGFPGVTRTLANVRKAGLVPVGTASDPNDAKRITIEERNGIRMGFMAYTYGTNGIPIPEDKPFAVNLIDSAAMRESIAELRRAGADVVTVSLHFGLEYHRMPSDAQIGLAHELIAAGSDIVLGSHPHVVQPYERVHVPASESADGVERNGVVIYSMGNFISNQSGDWKDVGLIFGVGVKKTEQPDGTSATEITQVTTTPTWVHIQTIAKQRHYTVIPMAQALAERNNATLSPQDYDKMKRLLDGINEHLTQPVGTTK